MKTSILSLRVAAVVLGGLGLQASALAQVTFSIDYNGPTISLPDSATGVAITEGDILTPRLKVPALGPLGQPGTIISGGVGGLGLALHAGCVGHPPGTPCGVEVDALSYGQDFEPGGLPPGSWWFSVDEFAVGLAGIPIPPTTFTEGTFGSREACADLFIDHIGIPPGPHPPFALPPGNIGALDGNGWWSASGFAYPGLGLLEWNPPGSPPDLGDNVDAFDGDGPVAPHGVYFSLDAAFFDPRLGLNNTGSAMAHGFFGGDVLFVVPGSGPPTVYAPATWIGLDRAGGPHSDDLDALAVWESGAPGYQPSRQPYDWLGGYTDMVLFSVRRGSAVIGAPDSIFGIPIEEGDILTTPFVGGASPFPGIFIAAENLGLATRRNGTPEDFADDLDALDITQFPVLDCNGNGQEDAIDVAFGATPDCNGNGVPDSCDIASGLSNDFNFTGVPDECEFSLVTRYCTAKVNSQGCTPIIGAYGTPSMTHTSRFDVAALDLVSKKNGLFFYGYSPNAAPWKGGFKCVSAPLRRTPVQSSAGVFPPDNCTGVYVYDMNAKIQSGSDPALAPGTTVFGQYWGRDPTSSFTVGLSDAIHFTIAP